MPRIGWRLVFVLAPVYVVLSSFLGLSAAMRFAGFSFMGQIWGTSLLADIIFVVGTILSGLVILQLSRRVSWIPAVLVGFLLHWATYTVSFVALEMTDFAGPDEAFLTVLNWGFIGLAFASLAPVFLSRAWKAERPKKQFEEAIEFELVRS